MSVRFATPLIVFCFTTIGCGTASTDAPSPSRTPETPHPVEVTGAAPVAIPPPLSGASYLAATDGAEADAAAMREVLTSGFDAPPTSEARALDRSYLLDVIRGAALPSSDPVDLPRWRVTTEVTPIDAPANIDVKSFTIVLSRAFRECVYLSDVHDTRRLGKIDAKVFIRAGGVVRVVRSEAHPALDVSFRSCIVEAIASRTFDVQAGAYRLLISYPPRVPSPSSALHSQAVSHRVPKTCYPPWPGDAQPARTDVELPCNSQLEAQAHIGARCAEEAAQRGTTMPPAVDVIVRLRGAPEVYGRVAAPPERGAGRPADAPVATMAARFDPGADEMSVACLVDGTWRADYRSWKALPRELIIGYRFPPK